jgi:glycosyltransferase involved in cell wall biosynthesis
VRPQRPAAGPDASADSSPPSSPAATDRAAPGTDPGEGTADGDDRPTHTFVASGRDGGDVNVLFAPNYPSNPYQGTLSEALAAEGVAVETAGEGLLAPLLRSYVGARGVDVLHLHWLHAYFHAPWLPLFYVRAALLTLQVVLLRLLGVRVVWTLHNLTSHEFPFPAAEARFKRLFVTHLCDAVIAHCDAAVDAAVEAYDLPPSARAKTHVVPHGHYRDTYDTGGDRAAARAALDLPPAGTVYLYFGMIRPYKNVPALIETFARVAGPDDHLLVAGNPHTPAARAAVERAAATHDRVRTRLEYVPDDEVRTYLLAADVVALPFRDTLTSGSAVLAMSFGRAFVAPAMGCLPALVGDDGGAILYDPDDDAGLADALRAAASADLAAMGARNRERVASFEWDDIAARTAAVYRAAGGVETAVPP